MRSASARGTISGACSTHLGEPLEVRWHHELPVARPWSMVVGSPQPWIVHHRSRSPAGSDHFPVRRGSKPAPSRRSAKWVLMKPCGPIGATTFKSLSEQFARYPGSVPSDFVPRQEAYTCAAFVKQRFETAAITRFGICVHGAGEYPEKLQDAAHPVALLYYQGWLDLVASGSVAVVGSRKPSRDGLGRTRRLVRELVNDDFTVVSGLAAGIERAAHETAMERNGRTIAVIGTPLSQVYPKEHTTLQRRIAQQFLLVSPVPVKRYESQTYRGNRLFFRERNVVMSALTEATIIVEAGETSGTLIQARAALQPGAESCSSSTAASAIRT